MASGRFQDAMKALKTVSPMRLAASISNAIVNQVRVRTVLGFLAIDLLISIGMFVLYFVFSDLALLGRIFINWKVYSSLAAIRAIFILFGMFALLKHRLHLAQIFFGLFVLNVVLLVFVALPVLRLTCECKLDWYQCSAMQVFARDGANIYYVPPPSDAHSQMQSDYDPPSRRMGIQQMPTLSSESAGSKQEATESLVEEIHNKSKVLQSPARIKGLSKRSMARLGILETDLVDNGHSAEKDSAPSPMSALQLKLQKVLYQHAKANSSIATIPNAAELAALLDVPIHDRHYVRLLCLEAVKKKQEALRLAAKKSQEEAMPPADDILGSTLSDVLSEEMKSEMKALVETWLQNLCGPSDVKAVIEATPPQTTIIPEDDYWDDADIATNVYLAPPSVTKKPSEADSDLDSDDSISGFRATLKNGKWGRVLSAVSRASENKLGCEFEQPSPSEGAAYKWIGLRRLQKCYKQSCRCDPQGCLYHESPDGNHRFWCYINERSRAACDRDNYEVKLDPSSGKNWTTQICETQGCQCSELGELPKKNDQSVHKTLLVDEKGLENELQYGSACNKWTSEDQFQWCWVGWDTTCIERVRPPTPTSYPKGLQRQFKSYQACSVNGLAKRREALRSPCENWKIAMETIFGLHLTMTLPMIVILYKLIANRLGDTFKVEEHFAVVSDDENDNDSGDEWEPAQTFASDAHDGVVKEDEHAQEDEGH